MEEELVQSSLYLLGHSVHPVKLGSCVFNLVEVMFLLRKTADEPLIRHRPGVVTVPAGYVLSVTVETSSSGDSRSPGNQ